MVADKHNWYTYVNNNPVNWIDAWGLTTEIDKETGYVMNVIEDGDTRILAYSYVDGEKVPGEPEFIGNSFAVDSFVSPDTGNPVGVVCPGDSIDQYMDDQVAKAGRYGKNKTFRRSRPGAEFDIKSQYSGHKGKSYHGFLFRGNYVTLREAGNILAGMNAAQFNMDFDDFQRGAGALHDAGLWGVFLYNTFGTTYGTAPHWGENEYQYSRSLYGYNLYKTEQKNK